VQALRSNEPRQHPCELAETLIDVFSSDEPAGDGDVDPMLGFKERSARDVQEPTLVACGTSAKSLSDVRAHGVRRSNELNANRPAIELSPRDGQPMDPPRELRRELVCEDVSMTASSHCLSKPKVRGDAPSTSYVLPAHA